MKNNITTLAFIIFAFFSASSIKAQKKTQLVDYVDNFIGVRDQNTSTILGPQLPNAPINPSPQTNPGKVNYDMDGYIMGNDIRGFGQLHVSGTGWGKYGQLLISPQIGLSIKETSHDSPKKDEFAKAFEYGVTLTRYGIKSSFTPSMHSAIYKFTFPKSDSAHIILDVSHNILDIATAMQQGKTGFIDGEVKFTDETHTSITGYGNYIGGFSDGPYKVYFSAKLNKTPVRFGTWLNGEINQNQQLQQSKKNQDRIGVYFGYNTNDQEEILMKIAVSFKSEEQATAWLDNEIPDWNYEKIKTKAKSAWNKELNKIKVSGGTDEEKTLFYTAAYHAAIMPRDKTNDAEGFEAGVPVWDDHLAVWDTWRTLYPLKVLTNQSMVSGTINSFIARFKKSRSVKDAYVALREMSVEQGGNNTSNIIVDAYVKGVKGVDWNAAYEIVKFLADEERLGISYNKQPDSSKMYKDLGWIPAGKMSNSVTLEYAYNDYCAALMAKGLNKEEDYEKYLKRSGKWIALWNPEAESDGYRGFIEPKKLNGDFIHIDLKKNWASWKDYFYEGSSWTYSYFVPHDFEKLISLSGGKEQFVEKLKHALSQNLIDFGNEPAFLTVQSFHEAGRSDLASLYTRKIMEERFSLTGGKENDDSGAMSSLYMFSAMGFFPNAGQDFYYLNGPSFKKISMTMSNGKQLIINAPNTSAKNSYIQSVKVNGKPYHSFKITHDLISKGAVIDFEMGNKPNNLWISNISK
jgi:predicted alpha-1,2-mannosidase